MRCWRISGSSRSATRSAALPDGSLVRRWARWSFDPATGLESTEDLWERVVDGAVGATFLQALRQLVEAPALMLV